jgi:carboxypeptidase family protein
MLCRLWPVRSASLVALIVVSLPVGAAAQSTIAGVVTDDTAAVLPGVSVEASSPALIEKVRTVVTNAEGRYSIVDVRPGAYVLTFSLPGFTTVRREEIEVAANVSVPVNVEMKVGNLQETVTVSGATPVVDVQQTARRQVLARDVIDALPTSRTYGSIGVVTPGYKLSKPDMGGIASFSQAYIRGRGKTGAENAMEIDGLDARNINGGEVGSYTNSDLGP